MARLVAASHLHNLGQRGSIQFYEEFLEFPDKDGFEVIKHLFFRRGSPLLVGIKAEGLESDSIPVQYSQEDHPKTYAHIPADLDPTSSPLIPRKKTSAMFRVDSDHVRESLYFSFSRNS